MDMIYRDGIWMENDQELRMQEEPPSEELMSSIENVTSSANHASSDPLEYPRDDELAEYARNNNLFVDHRLDPHFSVCPVDMAMRAALTAVGDDDVTSSDWLPPCQIPAVTSFEEKHSVLTGQAAKVMQEACNSLDAEVLESLNFEAVVPRSLGLKNVKLELPLLRSDHELDLREWKRQVYAKRDASVTQFNLPVEPVDIEKDEDLEFPSSAHKRKAEITDRLHKEKIEVTVSRQTLCYVKKAFDVSWSGAEQTELWESVMTYKRVSESWVLQDQTEADASQTNAREPMTPPLSPRAITIKHFVPDDESCQVPVPSDPNSQLSEELKVVEGILFQRDVLTPVNSDNAGFLLDNSPPTFAPVAASSDVGEEGPRLEDLKVDEPILPRDIHGPPTVEIDSLKDLIDNSELRLGLELEDVDMEDNGKELEALCELAENVMRSVEQETLQPIDTTARVPVPLMDFSIHQSPWKGFGCDANAMFKWIRENTGKIWDSSIWRRNESVERAMKWTPLLHHAGEISTAEQFKGDMSVLGSFFADIDSSVPTSSDYVWKRPGLAALREEDDDEDELQLIFSKSNPKDDLMTVLKKRRRDLENSSTQAPGKVAKLAQDNGRDSTMFGPNFALNDSANLLICDENNSHAKLLSQFLDLHVPKDLKVTKSKPNHIHSQHVDRHFESKYSEAAGSLLPAKKLQAALSPPINLPSSPLSIIVSVQLVPRSVRRRLELLIPGVELIERDYDRHNVPVWTQGSGTVLRSEHVSPLAYEADLTVSPATGIILTTMIKVRQKPQPGTQQSSIRERIEKVSARYERLLVLVSEGSIHEDAMASMSAGEAAAFAEFQGFLAGVEANATAFYVGGGDETLAKWVVALVCKHCHEGSAVQNVLVPEETHWELFLRRAGMNSYAAQAVPGVLRSPTECNQDVDPTEYGLAAFVQMTPAQRADVFGLLFGGRRVLDQVSRRVENRWPH